MALDLTFGSGGGGNASSSGAYVQDAFQDISLPATTNSGLTSSASTNPNSQYFTDNDAPKYSTKTLWVKGLKLIEDRSKWLSNKPTYEIQWNESFPGVYGYVCGDARMVSFGVSDGQCVLIRNASDFLGLTGNVRNVLWLVNPNASSTATAMRVTDGSDTSTIDFSSQCSDGVGRGFNHYAAFVHSASNATDDLHDYRLKAVQNDTLNIAGVVVFYENSGANIKVFPGNTYLNKTKITTSGITTMALPTGNTTTGFASVIYKTSLSTYGVTTQNVTPLVTGAAGSSGTNTITLTTGTGASFAAGMGYVIAQGSSYHVGNVLSVSTDSITTGATLPWLVSGATFWRAWYAGSTLAISATLFSKKFELDPIYASNPVEIASFGASTSGNYMFSEPTGAYRAWGSLQMTTAYNGIPVLKPLGATTGFLQIDGDFQAAEVEWVGLGSSSVLHATFAINGLAAWGQNQGFTGILKQTIFTDGQNGWNSILLTPGSSFLDVGISKINLYQLASPVGPTLGRLAEFSDHSAFVPRSAYNATLISLGLDSRHYADEFFLQGAWSRSATTAAAGGARYIGTSTNSVFKFQYYGQNFNILGTAGTSSILTVDGSSTTVSFNAIQSVATLGFHTIQFTCQSGTHLIEAIDIFKPKKEIRSLQNYNPLLALANIATTYVQSDTPRNAKNGDIWAEVPLSSQILPKVWIRMFGYWLQVSINSVSDDPHFDELFVYGGLVDNTATAQTTNNKFNSTSWALTTSIPSVKSTFGGGNNNFNGKIYAVSGIDSSSIVTTSFSFNKSAWATETAHPAGRQGHATHQCFSLLYFNKGQTTYNTASSVVDECRKYNGAAWSTGTVWSSARAGLISFFIAQNVYSCCGYDNTAAPTTTTEQRNAADSVSAATSAPATYYGHGGANINATSAMISQSQSGTAANATSYTFNGSAWSSSFSAPYSSQQCGGTYSNPRSVYFGFGGLNGSNVALASNFSYNGNSFINNSNMSYTSRAMGAGCI